MADPCPLQTFDDLKNGRTNKAFTGTEQTKLAGIAPNANYYTLENNAVTGKHLAPDAISSENIIDGAVLTAKIKDAMITTAKFAQGIKPVEIVSSLPTAGTQGRVVFLTTDNKLYRDTGTGWSVAVPTSDITGQITETQITDLAISTPKLAANAVTAAKIAAGTITATEIAADTITAGQIAVGAIGASEIAAGAIVAGKIAVGAITAAGAEIADLTVGTAKIGELVVTTPKIADGAVTAAASAFSPDVIVCTSGNKTPVQIVTIACVGGTPVKIDAAFYKTEATSVALVTLQRGASQIADFGTVQAIGNISFVANDVPSAGTQEYSLHITPTGDAQVKKRYLYLLHTKK